MTYTYDAVKREVREAVRQAAGAEVALSLTVPPAGVEGDLAVPCLSLIHI